MASGQSPIHIKPENKGKLRAALGTKDGKIPMGDLMKAKHSKSPAMRKRANFAISARKWSHG